MLDISKISHTDAYMDLWRKERRGKITASLAGRLIGENSNKGIFTKSAITYIDEIAAEIVTGLPAKEEFHTADTDYGNATEPEAINYYCEFYNKQVLRDIKRADTHRLIHYDELIACTPDALVCQASLENIFDATGTKLKVAPLEVKCPPKLHRYVKLFKCKTPLDLKKTDPMYFYQALSQLVWCNSLFGYFGGYHPAFPIKMRVITFDKRELIQEIKFFNDTIDYAKDEIRKTVEFFKQG